MQGTVVQRRGKRARSDDVTPVAMQMKHQQKHMHDRSEAALLAQATQDRLMMTAQRRLYSGYVRRRMIASRNARAGASQEPPPAPLAHTRTRNPRRRRELPARPCARPPLGSDHHTPLRARARASNTGTFVVGASVRSAASNLFAEPMADGTCQCHICTHVSNTVTCAFCEKEACDKCVHQCEECHDTFCSFCSTPNYDRSVLACFEGGYRRLARVTRERELEREKKKRCVCSVCVCVGVYRCASLHLPRTHVGCACGGA